LGRRKQEYYLLPEQYKCQVCQKKGPGMLAVEVPVFKGSGRRTWGDEKVTVHVCKDCNLGIVAEHLEREIL